MIDFGFDLAGRREPRLLRGAVFSVLGAIAKAGPVVLAIYALDRILSAEGEPLSWAVFAAGFSGFAVIVWLLESMGGVDNFVSTYRLVGAMRLRLLDHLRTLPLGFWQSQRAGTISSAITDQFGLYQEIVTHVWGMVIVNIAFPLVLGGLLVTLDWRLGLMTLVPVPFALAAIPWSYRLLDRGHDALIVAKEPVVAGLVETIDGLATLRSFGAEERAANALHAPMRNLEAQQMRTEVLPAPAILVFGLLVNLGFALTIALGSTLPIDPIRFVLALVLSLHFTRTLSELVIYLAEARFAARTLRRIRELFAIAPQPEHALTTAPSGHRLAVRGVHFAYDTRPALRGVDLTFEPDTVTALVGPSGSGKSTLALLLSRLWDVDDGCIELGGVDVRQMPLAFLHRQIATVFQDVVLFQGTVADNIRLGRPDATDDEVRQVARAAHAHDFIEALPDGYATLLGPGAHDLSGGQRQRLSIARAL
ncbi:MAG: ABC transporter ATP-binding protein, partial [Myxococcota bacterium]